MHSFDHERMDVYRRALEFIRLAASIRKNLAQVMLLWAISWIGPQFQLR
jgi:hypothetical protein